MARVSSLLLLFFVILTASASELVSRGNIQFPEIRLDDSNNYLNEGCSPLNDIWGFDSDESSYAVVGLANGIAIVDVTEENNPEPVSFPYVGCITEWRDMKTFGNHLYVVNDYTSLCDCSEDQQPCQQQLVVSYETDGSTDSISFRAVEGHAQAPLSDFPDGVSGILVIPSDSSACSSLPEDLSGKIAFIERGNCTFTEKTLNVQQANASGVVIADNSQEAIYPSMSGNNTGIYIPGLLIGSEDAKTIKELMQNMELTADLDASQREYSSLYSGPDGWVILDISDPTNVQVLNQTYEFFDYAHNILIDPLGRGLAYVCGQSSNSFNDTGGVLVFDLTIPHAPELIANFSTAYIHDIEIADRGDGLIVLYGAAIYDSQLFVIDVSDPWNTPDLNNQVISVTTTIANPHNTAQTEDGNYLYITHEEFTYPVTIWDSSNLTNLIYLGNFSVNAEQGTSPHNALVDGQKLWMSYYSEGVLVYDISENPVEPDELGQYDTSVDYDNGFHGVWGIFPYTRDPNLVYASDIESGMWVLRLVGDPTGSATPSPILSPSVSSEAPIPSPSASAGAPIPSPSASVSVSAMNITTGGNSNTTDTNTNGDTNSDNTFLWITISAGVLLAIAVVLLIGGIAAFVIIKKRVANNPGDDFDGRIEEDDLF